MDFSRESLLLLIPQKKICCYKTSYFFPSILLFSPILLYVICLLGGRKLQRFVEERIKQGLQEEKLLRNGYFCWNRRCGGHSRIARYLSWSTRDTLQTDLGKLEIKKVNYSSQGALEISNGKEGWVQRTRTCWTHPTVPKGPLARSKNEVLSHREEKRDDCLPFCYYIWKLQPFIIGGLQAFKGISWPSCFV